MRLVIACATLAALGLGGCILNPESGPYDPRMPRSEKMERIDPYHTDKIPDTAYEIWKRDQERNDKIAGKDGDTYPPLFKGQKDDKGSQPLPLR
jgi:hypothetical protein